MKEVEKDSFKTKDNKILVYEDSNVYLKLSIPVNYHENNDANSNIDLHE